ncbi:proto-oncogene c-Fos [Ctenocephalides felis]|uniref:proto-oncogene c-Fos n=1 Tax=Ctenocephalides felis TaxID=7515 RepID=UPI000E6E3AF0|nr:proto-oncogene c-Fos [Ctenocephalides felis]XP_026472665.1 proto-oncogene c-Fos [Ctenocephalides felis]
MYTPVSNNNGNMLAVDTCLGAGASVTPRTPEILNSLIAMTNPLDCSLQERQQREATTPTNSVQQTCSQLIKAGLKLSIQSKRKHSTSESGSGSKCEYNGTTGSEDDDEERMSPVQGLTPEDEERRRRRRERNKIAATKCRQKKRERTVNLVSESAVLETQNVDLKAQIKELDAQVRQLVDMLTRHSPSCLRKQNDVTLTNYSQSYASFCSSNPMYLQSATPVDPYIGADSINGFTDDVLRNTVLKHDADVYMTSAKDDTMHILPDINTFGHPTDISVPKIEDNSFDLSGEEETKYTDLDNQECFGYPPQQQCHQLRGVMPT